MGNPNNVSSEDGFHSCGEEDSDPLRRECHPCQEEVNRTMAALKHLQGCHNAPPHQSVLQRPENPHLRAEMSLRRRRLARINAYTVHCTHLLLLRVVHRHSWFV